MAMLFFDNGLGIALLLRGSSTDLPATLQAIELAQRTTGVVHAIFSDCFLLPIWSVIIQPWNDTVFEQIISGVTGAAGSTSAMEMMGGNLRNGLYRLKDSMK